MYTELEIYTDVHKYTDHLKENRRICINMHVIQEGMHMIRVGIIGATGYAGNELVRLLLQHPEAEIVWYGSKSYIEKPYAQVYRNMFRLVEDLCLDDKIEEMSEVCDVIFTATPQGYCFSILTENILQKVKVIDLSADFRLKDPAVYEQWYGLTHTAKAYIQEAVYGLCELNRSKVPGARLLANPGCYPTCSTLSIYPLLKEGAIETEGIIVDAKSGTSGAGRGAKVDNLFCEVNESMKAYGVATHRHTPEIEEQLSYAAGKPVLINFTPHLVPMNRGILVTAYGKAKAGLTQEEIRRIYESYYEKEPFVRVLPEGTVPETRWVRGSNYVDVNAKLDPRTGRVIMMGAIDNLVKGAAGQAVQNMNLLFGLPETTGLLQVPMFP